jgi:O-antigen/teichoic acid export membrane protein
MPTEADVAASRRLIWNTLSGYLKQGVACFAVLLFTPYFIREVGAAHYGLWTFLLSMLGFFELLDCGFSTTIVKYIAHERSTDDTENRNRVLNTVLTFFLIISLFGIAATAVISAVFLPTWTSGVDLSTARSVLWILALRVIILAMPFSVFRGALIGNLQCYVYNIINSIMYIIYVGLACYFLATGGGVQSVALANLLAMVFEWAALTIAAFWLVGDLKFSPRLIEWSSLRQIASFSTAQATANLTTTVNLRADPLIIRCFLSLTSVTTYGIGLRVVTFANQFIKQLSNALSPNIASEHGAGGVASVRDMLIHGSKYSLGVALIFSLPMCLLPGRVITAWIGPGFEGSATIMGILGCSLIASAPTMVAANVLAMAGRERRMMLYAVLGMTCNIGLSAALIRPMGIAGVAVATLVTEIIVGLWLTVGDACRGFKTNRWHYYRRAVLPWAPGACLHVMILLFARWLLPLESLFSIALVSGVAGLGFIAMWFKFDSERPPVPGKIVDTWQRLHRRLLPSRAGRSGA